MARARDPTFPFPAPRDAPPSPCQADFDADGAAGASNLGQFLGDWGHGNKPNGLVAQRAAGIAAGERRILHCGAARQAL